MSLLKRIHSKKNSSVSDPDPVLAKVPKIVVVKSLGKCLWESTVDKDVCIIVKNHKIFTAHKSVLRQRSPKLLDSGTNEVGKLLSIKIETHESDIVEQALLFCYDIQNFDFLSIEAALNLIKFASEYEMEDLVESLEELCIENLSVTNAVFFANASMKLKADKLYQKCFEFLLKCMKDGTAVKDIEEIEADIKDSLFSKSFVTKI